METSSRRFNFFNSAIFGVIIGFVFSILTIVITNYLNHKDEKRKANEANYLELAKYIELRTQRIISKAIDDTWSEFHIRLFHLTNSPIARDQADKHLERASALTDEIHKINADLIKIKTDLQFRGMGRSKKFDELFNKLYLFSPRHNYGFSHMSQTELIALSDSIPVQITKSLNDELRPQLQARTNELLEFVEDEIR